MNTSSFSPPFSQVRSLAAPASADRPEDGAAWLEALRILRRRIWLISLLTLLTCIAALPVILSVPKVYEAQTRVLVSTAAPISMANGMDGPTFALDLAAEIERLSSDAVAADVIARFDLAGRAEFNPALRPVTLLDRATARLRAALAEAGLVAPSAPLDDAPSDEIRRQFREALVVRGEGHADVITVGFASRDPELAAAVPGAVIDAFAVRRTDRWRADVADAANWLDRRITAESARLAQTRATPAPLSAGDADGAGPSPREVEGRLAWIAERRSDLERELFEVAARQRSIAAALVNPNQPAQTETEQLEALRTQLQGELRERERLARITGESHDLVAMRDTRIATLRSEIAAALTALDNTLRVRATAIEDELQRLATEAAATGETLAALRESARRMETRSDELSRLDESLGALVHRRQVLLSQDLLAPVSLEVVDPARVPDRPAGLDRKALLLAVGLGGLLVSMAAAAVAELRDTTVRSHEQLVHLPQVSPVGLWPGLSNGEAREMRRAIRAGATTPPVEALRDMLLMIEAAHGGRLPRVLTVASPRARDMSSPIAEWIAFEIAASGRKVRLLESCPAVPGGLLRLLSGKAHEPEPSEGIRRQTFADVFGRPGEGREAAVRCMLDDQDADEGITIVAAPPLLSAGALRYARLGGAVLLVLRWGVTPRVVVDLTTDLLAKVGVIDVLSVITDANRHRHRLYGYTDRLALAPPGRAG